MKTKVPTHYRIQAMAKPEKIGRLPSKKSASQLDGIACGHDQIMIGRGLVSRFSLKQMAFISYQNRKEILQLLSDIFRQWPSSVTRILLERRSTFTLFEITFGIVVRITNPLRNRGATMQPFVW